LGRSRAARPLRTRVGRREAPGAGRRCFARGCPALGGIPKRWRAEVAARVHLGGPAPVTALRIMLSAHRRARALGLLPAALALLARCTALDGRRPLATIAGRYEGPPARWRSGAFGIGTLRLRFLTRRCGRSLNISGSSATLVVSRRRRTLDTVIVRWSRRALVRTGMRCRRIRVGRPQPGLLTLPWRWSRCRVRGWRRHVRPRWCLGRGRPTRRGGRWRLGMPVIVRRSWHVVAAFAVGHCIHPIGGFAEYPHIVSSARFLTYGPPAGLGAPPVGSASAPTTGVNVSC
jgi:hypothetical protein